MPWSRATWTNVAVGAGLGVAVVAIGAYYWHRRAKRANSGETSDRDAANSAKSTGDTARDRALRLKAKGNEHFSKGDYVQAIEVYTRAIAECPETAVGDLAICHQNRAAAYEKQNETANVIADLNKAIELNAHYTKAYLRRAKAFETSGDLASALTDLTTACLLESFSQRKNVEHADRVVKELGQQKAKEMHAARNGEMLPISDSYVHSYLTTFVEDPILNHLGEIDETKDTSSDSYHAALVALKQRRYSDVVPACSAFLDSASGSVASTRRLRAHLLRATFAYIQGNAELAGADFDAFFAMLDAMSSEQRGEHRKFEANALIKRGCYHMQMGDKDRSLQDLALAETVDAANADLYHHRGQLLVLLSELDKAQEDFAKCMQLQPNFALAKVQACYARYRAACVANSMTGATRAIIDFERTVDENAQCAEGFALLGQVYVEQSNFDEANKMYDKALLLQPQNANIYVHKGLLVLQATGNREPTEAEFKRAIELMQRATRVDAHCEFAYETLGQLHVQRNRLREAIEYFDRAINLVRTELELAHLFGLRCASEAQIEAAARLGFVA